MNVNLRLKIMHFQWTQSMHSCDFVQQRGTAQMQVQRRQRVGSSMGGGLSDEYHRGGGGMLRVFAKDS